MRTKLVLLSLLIALPLVGQTPIDPKDVWAKYGQATFSLERAQEQVTCLKGIVTKGEELSKAVQAMQDAAKKQGVDAIKKPDGSTWMSDATKAAEDFQKAEKACMGQK